MPQSFEPTDAQRHHYIDAQMAGKLIFDFCHSTIALTVTLHLKLEQRIDLPKNSPSSHRSYLWANIWHLQWNHSCHKCQIVNSNASSKRHHAAAGLLCGPFNVLPKLLIYRNKMVILRVNRDRKHLRLQRRKAHVYRET